MKRWMLTGILGIGLVTSSTLFSPPSAGAWWTDVPLQEVVYLEGDPESPDLASGGGEVEVANEQNASGSDVSTPIAALVLSVFLEVLLP
jgi:hypothetical protein